MIKKFKSLLIIVTMIFTVLSPAAVMANNPTPVTKDVTICEKLGHDLNIITSRPTCEDVGRIATTCLRCDYEDMIIIAASGHDLINEVIIEPTCERYGSITANCSCCDYEEEIISVRLEHYFESKITVPPTFETEGVETHTCIHCNESYTSVIPKLDPAIVDILRTLADDVLKNGLTKDNLLLSNGVLRLIISGCEIILSTDAKNFNIEGEVHLGGEYYLVFDIKGNGSNVKKFEVIRK